MEVEWLILADAAQVVGGKLYLLGGGWDRLTMNRPLPTAQNLAVAASFRVPWNETNIRHTFKIVFADGDGKEIGKVEGGFEVGRPAGIPPGQDQRTQIAVGVTMRIEKLGTYQVTSELDGQEDRVFPFSVAAGPGLAPRQQSQDGEPPPQASV